MKKFFFIMLFTISFNSGFSQTLSRYNTSHIERCSIKGKVKSLVTKSYLAEGDSINVKKAVRLYSDGDSSFFNNKGYVLESYYLDHKGKLEGHSLFEYDKMNYRTASKTYNEDGDLTNHTLTKNVYDKNGNIIEIASESSGKAIVNNFKSTKSSYKYDLNGNRIESLSFNSNGILNFRTTYKHNDRNMVIEEILTYPNGGLLSKDVYDYDENGNRILWEHYYKDGRLVSRIVQKYDKDNNLIVSEEGGFTSKYLYDSFNNKIEQKTYDMEGDLSERKYFTYKYDLQNNWTECIEFKNGKPKKIIERKIEYH